MLKNFFFKNIGSSPIRLNLEKKKNLKINEIEIEIFENRVILRTWEKSDLGVLFCILKNLLTKTDSIPISLYTISGNTKNKKSLNKFKNIDFWEFIDFKEESEDNSFNKSGESFENKVDGWEVRFRLIPSSEDINSICFKSMGDANNLTKKFKIEANK
jgi:hypothetical protein